MRAARLQQAQQLQRWLELARHDEVADLADEREVAERGGEVFVRAAGAHSAELVAVRHRHLLDEGVEDLGDALHRPVGGESLGERGRRRVGRAGLGRGEELLGLALADGVLHGEAEGLELVEELVEDVPRPLQREHLDVGCLVHHLVNQVHEALPRVDALQQARHLLRVEVPHAQLVVQQQRQRVQRLLLLLLLLAARRLLHHVRPQLRAEHLLRQVVVLAQVELNQRLLLLVAQRLVDRADEARHRPRRAPRIPHARIRARHHHAPAPRRLLVVGGAGRELPVLLAALLPQVPPAGVRDERLHVELVVLLHNLIIMGQPQEDYMSGVGGAAGGGRSPSRFSEVSGVLKAAAAGGAGGAAQTVVNSPYKRNSLLMMAQQSSKKKPETVEEIYSEIQGYIEVLDQRMERVLEKHEKDFLTAYRSHMMKVQKELDFLRSKADDQEANRRQDEKLLHLEQRLDWFRAEAVTLGKSCQQYKYAKDIWKSKAENLQEDRRFLEYQIRAQHRQNKLLRLDLRTQQKQFQSLRAEHDTSIAMIQEIADRLPEAAKFESEGLALDFPPKTSLGESVPATEPIRPPDSPSGVGTVQARRSEGAGRRQSSPKSPIAQSVKAYAKSRLSATVLEMIEAGLTIQELLAGIDSFAEADEQRHSSQIAILQAQLDREKERNRQLRQPRVAPVKGPDLEDIFFQCVEQVKLDTFHRKQRARFSSSSSRRPPATAGGAGGEAPFTPQSHSFNIGEVSSFTGTQVASPGGYLPEVSSKKEVIFTAEEKRRAMELLLEKEEVLQTLNQVIFHGKQLQKLEESTNLFKVRGQPRPQLGPYDDAVSTATHQAVSDHLLRQNYQSVMADPYEGCVRRPRIAKSLKACSSSQSRPRLQQEGAGRLPIVLEQPPRTAQPGMRAPLGLRSAGGRSEEKGIVLKKGKLMLGRHA